MVMKKELFRQLIHASGVFIVVLSYFLNPNALILIAVLSLLFVGVKGTEYYLEYREANARGISLCSSC